jgi:imidazolonepropionase-like amidohydrolase/Tol biopolymer transport system component
MRHVRLLALALLATSPGTAQEPGRLGTPPVQPDDGKAEDGPRPLQPAGQTLPLKPARRIAFSTDVATWASVDVSPNGRTILFDLLGDLYAVGAAGGRAKRIGGGMAVEAQPVYAPDGKSIAFVSDRSGSENLWVAGPDGKAARQISFGDDDTVLVSPAWSADGRFIFVSRYRSDLNAYELWRHDLTGGARLLIPIRDKPDTPRSDWRSSLGAAASPDGRFLYFARRTGSSSPEEMDEWTVVRRDLASGDELTIVGEPEAPGKAGNPGAAFRPALSPDGRLLAYAARVDGRTELRLRDLMTGADRRLAYPIERDQLQASMWQDIVPRYDFTPDGKWILLSRNGRLERLPVQGGEASRIPFLARIDLELGRLARADIREETGPVRARIIQTPETSPDGRRLAFSALGRLYVMNLAANALPRHLATPAPAFHPSWSADGRRVAFVTWTAREGGHVWTAPADGSAPPLRVTRSPAYYTSPVFRPGTDEILAVRSPHAARLRTYMEYGNLRDAELVAVPAAGGAARTIVSAKLGSKPQFTIEAGKAYLLFEDGLNEIDLSTGRRGLVALVKGPGWYFQDGPVPVDDVRISPDGKWLLAQVAQQLHLVARPPAERPEVDLGKPRAPHRRVTAGGADFFGWSRDGQSVEWTVGSTFSRRGFKDIALNPAGRANWSADKGGRAVGSFKAVVELPRDVPQGRLLLRGARAITMAGSQVIEDSDILVADGRIAAIGARGTLAVPPGTLIREVPGKTIVPGYIDTHDHVADIRRDVIDFEPWGLRARLAYGITTAFDPSTLTVDMLAYHDLLDAGLALGPRLASTATALFSMQRFASLDEVREVLRRYRDDYRVRNIKQYRTGSRKVRQWIAQAAAELGLQTTAEGALAMKLDLSHVLDGYGSQEHALVAVPLGRDWVELMARSGTAYTTTLQITNGGPPAQDAFIAEQNPHDDPKYRHFTPHFAADQSTRRREWRSGEEYRYPAVAEGAAAIHRAGGLVGMGAHGDIPGIGYHWELEAHAAGGMSPNEILRAATIGAARAIGRAAELGSLEPGKFADLVILDRDPREHIRNAREISAVMKNGRLYQGNTLDQLWPDAAPLRPAWFADDQWLFGGEKK